MKTYFAIACLVAVCGLGCDMDREPVVDDVPDYEGTTETTTLEDDTMTTTEDVVPETTPEPTVGSEPVRTPEPATPAPSPTDADADSGEAGVTPETGDADLPKSVDEEAAQDLPNQ